MSCRLDQNKRLQIESYLAKFQDVLQDRPGDTNITAHAIDIGEARPVKQHPYQLPQAYRGIIRTQLKEMVAGIIEPSSSEWASPIVLVGKKDGTVQMCVDYRKVIAIALTSAYPMPRIDDLIDQLGSAKYLTTLHLARGYWQVPVATESQK